MLKVKIIRLKTNRITNPLGFTLDRPRLSYVVTETEAKKQAAARIVVALDDQFHNMVHDSGIRVDIDPLAYELSIELQPRTRYFWRVEVWADNGDYAISEIAWFETAKMDEPWIGKWIIPEMDKDIHPTLSRTFELDQTIVSARAYICGLGLYEMKLNGVKVGNEYLTPHFNAYQKWLQYQTYDITNLLAVGLNHVEVMLGNGLYKGRYGFDGISKEIYGSEFALLCDLVITYADGSSIVIGSDQEWIARKSCILDSNLYDGEVYDATLDVSDVYPVREGHLGYERLQARRSLPVVVKEELKPVACIHTPAGETVLDMGQNMVGWVKFRTAAPRGTTIKLSFGEVLQDGFYRDNLRTAKAEYVYTSDGQEIEVRPHFTYYGFRYVKVEGWPGAIDMNDFTGCVLYSDLDLIGHIETSHTDVNRLFLNALWGQKGNFLDVPTDCPQRDEKMGWTGDAQVFSGTACFNMDSYAFFNKYLYDMGREQEDRGGMVPNVVPAANVQGGGSSAWADAATIIPWNVYMHYGDQAILEQQFESMRSWVDYIKKADDESGGRRLWTVGFHFGDWLALDGSNPDSPMGGTDTDLIATAYYCYSARIVSKAAKVLGKHDIAEHYARLSAEVKQAFIDEFFTKNGRLAQDTQTAYAVALYMDLVPEEYKPRVVDALRKRLKIDRNHLKTGFVGTPYLNRVLSDHDCDEIAYTLLLNEDYPSWLYAVKLGATTIWERWNSLQPDGKISETGMNSLNHYAYGAIAEWMYRVIGGIHPVEESPGFRRVLLAPKPDYRLKWAKCSVDSAAGFIRSEWSFNEEGHLTFRFEIPFHSSAAVRLPYAKIEALRVNGSLLDPSGINGVQVGEEVHLELVSGVYEIFYVPTKEYIKKLSTYTPLVELLLNDQANALITKLLPAGMESLDPDTLRNAIGDASLRDLKAYYPMEDSMLDQLDQQLGNIKI